MPDPPGMMQRRIQVVTLAVETLERALAFYREPAHSSRGRSSPGLGVEIGRLNLAASWKQVLEWSGREA